MFYKCVNLLFSKTLLGINDAAAAAAAADDDEDVMINM